MRPPRHTTDHQGALQEAFGLALEGPQYAPASVLRPPVLSAITTTPCSAVLKRRGIIILV